MCTAIKEQLLLCAGRVKLEIVHILANDTTLRLFKESPHVLGSQLPLTELQAGMRIDRLKEYMEKAQADNSRPYVLVLRSREGAMFNIMSILGMSANWNSAKYSPVTTSPQSTAHSHAYQCRLQVMSAEQSPKGRAEVAGICVRCAAFASSSRSTLHGKEAV